MFNIPQQTGPHGSVREELGGRPGWITSTRPGSEAETRQMVVDPGGLTSLVRSSRSCVRRRLDVAIVKPGQTLACTLEENSQSDQSGTPHQSQFSHLKTCSILRPTLGPGSAETFMS